MLSERKLEIIKLLHNTSLEIDEIADILNVSSRTIRRDLINIVETLSDMGYKVEKNKLHYKIVDEDSTLFESLNLKSANDFITEEKLVIGLKSISFGKDTIDIESVANELYVTVPSLKTVICQFLEEYNVTYRTKGMKLTLDITNIERREILVAVIRDYIRTTDINSIVLEASIQSNKVRNNQILQDYIDQNDFDRLFINIENIFNDSNQYVTDFQLIMIVITVCVSITQAVRNPLKIEKQNMVSNKIIEQIICESGITNNSESIYLVAKLESIITELEYEKVNLALISEISEAILEVERKLGIEFVDRRKLEYQICTHNARTTNSNGDVYLGNNLSLRQFVAENQYLFEIIRSVEALYAGDEENLQYLLIYFVMAVEETLAKRHWLIYVICFGGVGTSLMIKKQLEKEYPNSQIQNLSYARALSGTIADADLIISNSKLPNNLQNLVVGHIITKSDVKQINSILLNQSSYRDGIGNLDEIIYNIGCQLPSSEYNQATQLILRQYVDNGIINNSEYIFQKLKKREIIGVGIPDSNIAFFHTRSSSINSLVISTYTVDSFKTVGFDGVEMTCYKILLVLVPVNISDDLLDKVNILSYSLISDGSLLTAIETDDKQKIQSVIQK